MPDENKLEITPEIEQAWTKDVRLAVRRLSLFYHAMTTSLIAEFGEAEAKRLTEKIVWDYGTLCGEATRDAVLAQGKPLNYENFHSIPDLPSKGWETGMTTAADGNPQPCVSYCPIADVFRQYNTPLARSYCMVDPAKYEGYDPTHTMKHSKHVMDGDDCCVIEVAEKLK